MANNNSIKYRFDSFEIIQFVQKYFKILIIICVLGVIVSAVVSLLIEEKYKSTVILFPTSSGSISKALLTDNVTAKGILNFGEEEEVEQMLQVLQSDEIKNKIIEKYDLIKHYEIEPDSKYKMTNLNRVYNSNVSIERTEFMSVKISVLDKEPQMAANIANDIAAYLDTAVNRMQKDRARKALKVVENEYFDLVNQIKTLEDSLVSLRELGIYDYESQAEVYSDAYAQAVASGTASAKNIEKLENKLHILAKYGGAYISIRDFLEFEKKQLSDLKAKYAEAKVDAEQDLPHKFIVNSAYKAEKKSYPIRWLIVVISTFATFIITFLTLAVYDIFKKNK